MMLKVWWEVSYLDYFLFIHNLTDEQKNCADRDEGIGEIVGKPPHIADTHIDKVNYIIEAYTINYIPDRAANDEAKNNHAYLIPD